MPEPEEQDNPFSEIPEEIVRSVLGQAGFSDTLEPPQEQQQQEQPPVVATEEQTPQEQGSGNQGGSETPPAPGGPLFQEEQEPTEGQEESDDIITLSDGTKYPKALIEEWAKNASRPPALPPTPVVEQQQQEQQQTPTPYPLPQLTEEDLEMAGPAVRALLLIAHAQANDITSLRTQVSQAQQVQQQNAQTEAAKVLNAATSAFKQEFNLPDELMSQIATNAVPEDVSRHIAQHQDPYEAVKYALTRSYWNLPEARQFEFQRQAANLQAAKTRKQKLAGVGGSNGPSSRNQPVYDESTPEGRHAAAVELVRQQMYGDEQ